MSLMRLEESHSIAEGTPTLVAAYWNCAVAGHYNLLT
jgi:hypothetical protein